MQRELEKDVGVYGRSSDPRCLFLLPGEGNCPLLKFSKSHSSTASMFKANKWMAHRSPEHSFSDITLPDSETFCGPVGHLLLPPYSAARNTTHLRSSLVLGSNPVTPLSSCRDPLELRLVILSFSVWNGPYLLLDDFLSLFPHHRKSVILKIRNLFYFSPFKFLSLSLKSHLNFLRWFARTVDCIPKSYVGNSFWDSFSTLACWDTV